MSDQIDFIKDSIDIIEYIKQDIELKMSGYQFSGICPFHAENKPSFFVHPKKQTWYCFGCGEGGDVIKYVMKRDDIDFIEAIKLLALEAGINVAGEFESRKKDNLQLEKNVQEMQFYMQQMQFANKGHNYILDRFVNPDTLGKFFLGWDGEKVVIPLMDESGNVLAFDKRSIDGSQPKSKVTAGFNKKNYLYGLYQALESIKAKQEVILVEGPWDLYAVIQKGYTNTLAILGSRISDWQVKYISRLVKSVITFFDGDDAGVEGSRLAMAAFSQVGIITKIYPLSDEVVKDPHSVIEKDKVDINLEDDVKLSFEYFIEDLGMEHGVKNYIDYVKNKLGVSLEAIINILRNCDD